jgi:hypothetical protein
MNVLIQKIERGDTEEEEEFNEEEDNFEIEE